MPRIPEETIQEVLAATDIVDLIGSHFPLKRVGSNFRALCPFHREKTPSFNVNPARQTYHCFGCQAGGNAFRFLMEYENVDFPTAVRRLAERNGIVIPEAEYDPLADERSRLRTRLLSMHHDAAAWFHHLLFKKDVAAPARTYLQDRGIGMETARTWQLGYAPPSGDLLRQWAQEKGYAEDILVAGGLLRRPDEDSARPGGNPYPWFRHRLMFPVANDFGDTIAFSGRLLDPEAKAAKYINSPETIIFTKGKTFYGLDKTKRAILHAGSAIVCEGQLDLIACHTAEIENVVAPLGTAFTEHHARILKRHAQEVILCFDSDNAGYNAAEKTFASLARSGMIARVIEMPPGEDPDSLIKKQGPDTFRALVDQAKDFFDFQIAHKRRTTDLHSMRDRTRVASEIAASIGLVEDKILRDPIIKKVCVELSLPESEFRELIVSTKRRESQYSPFPDETSQSQRLEPVRIDNRNLLFLARALLTSQEARDWLRANSSPEFLDQLPQSDLVSKLWNAPFDVDNQLSMTSYLSSLSPPEEAFIAQLLNDDTPDPGLDSVAQCIRSLQKHVIKRELEQKITALMQPSLDPETIRKLEKESLDLKSQLTDIARSHPENT